MVGSVTESAGRLHAKRCGVVGVRRLALGVQPGLSGRAPKDYLSIDVYIRMYIYKATRSEVRQYESQLSFQ
jgi:hypothetical protein